MPKSNVQERWEKVQEKRIKHAVKSVRRAVDLVMHGAAAELVNEDFVSTEEEAWRILGAGAVAEIEDHGFFVKHGKNQQPFLITEEEFLAKGKVE